MKWTRERIDYPKRKSPFPSPPVDCGQYYVYAFVDAGRVVYVGMTGRIQARIGAHRRGIVQTEGGYDTIWGRCSPDLHVRYRQVESREDAFRIEANVIGICRPQGNGTKPSRHGLPPLVKSRSRRDRVADRAAETARRRRIAFEMRRRGRTFREIGEELGVTKQRAHQLTA